jgi:hypothetical protein
VIATCGPGAARPVLRRVPRRLGDVVLAEVVGSSQAFQLLRTQQKDDIASQRVIRAAGGTR